MILVRPVIVQHFYTCDFDDSVVSLFAIDVAGFEGTYSDLARNLGPNLNKFTLLVPQDRVVGKGKAYFIRTKGIGIKASAMNPSSEDAHRGFSLSYICVANNGNPAPARLRMTVFDARAEAATTVYESMM